MGGEVTCEIGDPCGKLQLPFLKAFCRLVEFAPLNIDTQAYICLYLHVSDIFTFML